MNTVDIGAYGIEQPDFAPRLERYCQRVLEILSVDGWSVSVVLCNDLFIEDLNLRFRGLETPTDVLTFRAADEPTDHPTGEEGEEDSPPFPAGPKPGDWPLFAPDEELYEAGDIVISLETVRRNCAESGVEFEEDLKRMTVHGILHLKGMDHEEYGHGSPLPESDPMIALQEDVMKKTAEERIL